LEINKDFLTREMLNIPHPESIPEPYLTMKGDDKIQEFSNRPNLESSQSLIDLKGMK